MISIEIANLEIALGGLLAAVLHIDPAVGRRVYLTPPSGIGRLKILENSVELSFSPKGPGKARLDGIIADCRSVIGRRHQYVHDAWGTDAEKPFLVVRTALPPKVAPEHKEVSINELNVLIRDIRHLNDDIVNETRNLFEDWPPYTLPEEYVRQSLDEQPVEEAHPQKGNPPKPKRQPRSSLA